MIPEWVILTIVNVGTFSAGALVAWILAKRFINNIFGNLDAYLKEGSKALEGGGNPLLMLAPLVAQYFGVEPELVQLALAFMSQQKPQQKQGTVWGTGS